MIMIMGLEDNAVDVYHHNHHLLHLFIHSFIQSNKQTRERKENDPGKITNE